MNERVDAWIALATERLDGSGTPLYLIPGNDDDFAIDPILDEPTVRAGQRRRQGARPTRRATAPLLRLVEQHAMADAA